ncbi:MAG: hypothetical protein NT003_03930 [Candidatus Magasanikbacteria bacterium]|nr:hypothetical protein [Candidatus Magasanikbacteria bacterium]
MRHVMPIRGAVLDTIIAGTKTLIICVGFDWIREVHLADELRLIGDSREFLVRIVAVRHYESFEAMLSVESSDQISPGRDSVWMLETLRKIHAQNEALGVYVMEISKPRKSSG